MTGVGSDAFPFSGGGPNNGVANNAGGPNAPGGGAQPHSPPDDEEVPMLDRAQAAERLKQVLAIYFRKNKCARCGPMESSLNWQCSVRLRFDRRGSGASSS